MSKNLLNRINQLHQVAEGSAIANRERISLAHINTGKLLREHGAKVVAAQAAGRKANEVAANLFSVGQIVKTRMAGNGEIVAIDGGKISVNLSGVVRQFVAGMLSAA